MCPSAIPDGRANVNLAFVQTQPWPRIRQLQKDLAFGQTHPWLPQSGGKCFDVTYTVYNLTFHVEACMILDEVTSKKLEIGFKKS